MLNRGAARHKPRTSNAITTSATSRALVVHSGRSAGRKLTSGMGAVERGRCGSTIAGVIEHDEARTL
jgi:hypothetical protein